MASIVKREGKKGFSYRVRVRKGGRYISKSFSRLTDAKSWASEMESKIDSRRLPTSEALKHTLADLIDRYIENELSDVKTAKDKARHLKWWKDQVGGIKLADITPTLLSEYRDNLKKRMQPGTVNRYLTSISHAFSVAVREWGWIDSNPISNVRKLKEPRGRVRFLSEDSVDRQGRVIHGERTRLLDACRESRSPVLHDVVVLALSTGMRQGEIMNLTWKDVDFRDGRITLLDTKNGDIRAIPITGLALDLLKKRSKVRRIHSQLIFPDKTGKAPAKFRDSWLRALERAEIEDFRFHDLRHTAASYLAMSGATLAEIAEILGHKTLSMVKRYSHFSTDHVSGVISKLDTRMFGGGS
ncbi:MAG: tyrosine-type recombinase/integrase [Candidatus Thiodiazotropha taylori]|nr:tyrosine-type recombinase/integrase [Candidatus Thiodiazotropha taylori]